MNKASRRQRVVHRFLFVALGCLALLGWALVEPGQLREDHRTIVLSDLPPAFDGLKVVFASDFHVSHRLPVDRLRKVVQQINAWEPDMVILGGDLVDRQAGFVGPAVRVLADLRAPRGVYAVLGNHDNYGLRRPLLRALGENGIQVLENDGIWLEQDGQRLRIAGTADSTTARALLEPSLADAQSSDCVVLVSHNPDAFESWLEHPAIDLGLAGHTHGGQVTLFGLWAPVSMSRYGEKYRGGEYRYGTFPLLVSKGIGTSGVPLRFGALPEFHCITLKP